MIDPSLKRRKPLSRFPKRKAEVRVGKVSGTVRLSGQALERLRGRRYAMDNGRCTWRKGKPDACGKWMPFYGSVFNRAHMAHIKGRGAGGGDAIENTTTRCYMHHIEFEHVKGIKD